MGMSKADLLARIDNDTRHHPPSSEEIVKAHEAIRDAARDFMTLLVRHAPVSRELSLALTKAEEAMMHANSAVARNQSTGE